MPGPFPGMDPYLEAQGLWESFHPPLVTHCTEALNQRLPYGYVAKIETRVAMVSLDLPLYSEFPMSWLHASPICPPLLHRSRFVIFVP